MTQLFHDDALAPISRGPAPHISVNVTHRRVHWRVAPAILRGGTEDKRGRAKSHAANTLRTPPAKSNFPRNRSHASPAFFPRRNPLQANHFQPAPPNRHTVSAHPPR